MSGPRPGGNWRDVIARGSNERHQFLVGGRRYRVVKPFTDYDNDPHPVGEEWIWLGHSFIPYDDGMSFFVSLDGVNEWQIRLQWRPEAQAEFLDHLADYLLEIPTTA